MRLVHTCLNPLLRACGAEVRRYQSPEADMFNAFVLHQNFDDQPMGGTAASTFLQYVHAHFHESSAQLFQDLFVRYVLKEMRNGFFVEFGASDGVHINNTVHLERDLGWTGILVEPARVWHSRLKANRHCIVDDRCVWKRTGETLSFSEVLGDPEMSTIDAFSGADRNGPLRKRTRSYEVSSISLHDLLIEHQAPTNIDFLSIDTEGTEYEILRAFNFSAWNIRLICVEHNRTGNRSQLLALLTEHGYQRRFAELTKWDDWYVKVN